ncbi:MAG: PKD domain-containing protein [Bacteroidota bacterium]|nr:PKD domain-containing protein [Bacteroidota bacterium]
MRKLCVLLAAIALIAVSLPANARAVSPDVANFTFSIDPSNNNVTFTNTSSIGSEPGTRKAFWSFGDGSSQWTGALDGTQHHYQSAGTYTVCLKIYRYASNTNDSVLTADICKTVTIESTCSANFESVASTATTLGKYFIAQPWHSQSKKPLRVCWTFGDNHDTCIQYTTTYTGTYNTYHLYAQPGTYNVCVDILYDGGCEAHSCHTIQTGEQDSCHADFESPATSPTALGKYFIAQPWHNHNKKPVQVCWTFGDNRDTCIQYPVTYTGTYAVYHLYAQPGSYNVCVTIHYDGGCEAHTCHIIQTGEADSCRADFERIPTTSSNVLSASFRALPWHNHNKKPSQICWTFGDGTDTCIHYGQDYTGSYAVNHNYQQAGQYEVCIRIIYDGGCEAMKCKLVVIPNENSCAVNIFEITPSITSLERAFYASVISAPNHPVDHICWNFGDGTDTCITATSSSPPSLTIHHTYPGPGVYRICVRVVFQGGCVAENCHETVIRGPNDRCGGYMTDSLTGPRTFKFSGFSIHSPNDAVISYHWTFGDGTSAVGQEVTHVYNTGGEFRVCLTILTQMGCETRICNTVRVPGNNQTGLVLSPNPVVNTLHALFFSTHAETVMIRIINSNGIAIRTYTRNVTVGANNWDFDLSALLPGVYLFTVQSPDQQASAMFLKQ